MGNICRSPTAHGIFQSLVDAQGLSDQVRVESAGTHSYHIGNPPDLRSQATALAHGVDISSLKAQHFSAQDFLEFDYLLAMDSSNLNDMLELKPANATAQLQLMLEYSKKYSQREVPDPYYGNNGFELVFDMVNDACDGLLEAIRVKHQLQD